MFVDAVPVLCAAKLAPVGYGIKKLVIMMTIEDDLVSVDNLIEDYLLEEPRNEFIQSCDIVAFNKICKNSSFFIGCDSEALMFVFILGIMCLMHVCFLQKLVWSC